MPRAAAVASPASRVWQRPRVRSAGRRRRSRGSRGAASGPCGGRSVGRRRCRRASSATACAMFARARRT
eukprot:3331001-Prymnesium_polylepis.1